jgi:2-oxoglutarate dehydrogenase E2 component (dihydrolipoamide succinyltransferase)
MTIEIVIPQVGESIYEMQIGRWLKQEGDRVAADENIVELETDKASMELPAPAAGVISRIIRQQGESVSVGETIAHLEEDGRDAVERPPTAEPRRVPDGGQATPSAGEEKAPVQKARGKPSPEGPEPPAPPPKPHAHRRRDVPATPSARRALRQHGLSAEDVEPSGATLRREDVLRHIERQKPRPQRDGVPPEKVAEGPSQEVSPAKPAEAPASDLEEVVPMSLIRRRIAKRLVEARRQAALLTTFNEIDMTAVIELRHRYRQAFEEKYKIKLGFMSFFVKAAIDALRQFPQVNAEVRGTDIVFRNYYDIGIAVATDRGLVVPVLRHAERMTFAEIERAIDDFARRAREKKLTPDELAGGTFTITNGGVFGSLLSTPIVNPPQSGVLGMHAIQERAVAREGQVVIRPMMYVALTYDHRVVDGREAVLFLRRVKEAIEEPSRMLMEV